MGQQAQRLPSACRVLKPQRGTGAKDRERTLTPTFLYCSARLPVCEKHWGHTVVVYRFNHYVDIVHETEQFRRQTERVSVM